MPIRRKAADAGIFDRAELALLGRVIDQLKLLDDQSPDAQGRLASRIIANYMAGIRTRPNSSHCRDSRWGVSPRHNNLIVVKAVEPNIDTELSGHEHTRNQLPRPMAGQQRA